MKTSLAAVALVWFAQEPKVDQAKVDAAVSNGARYLLDALRQGLHDADMSKDELVFYTLIHAGTDPSDPTFQKLLGRLLEKDLSKTYCVSLLAMGLEAFDRKKYQARIAQCAQFLVDNQANNGQWDYGEPDPQEKPPKDVATGSGRPDTGRTESDVGPPIAVKRRRLGRSNGDNSNSQYAALGLRACHLANVRVPLETLQTAAAWWENGQNKDGGWGYCGQGVPDAGHGSMTAGAVGALAIYDSLTKADWKKDARIQRGVEWIARWFTVKENPKYQYPRMWHYYWLYAVERLGMLLATETFGRSEWYSEGAEFLLGAQSGAGCWDGQSRGGPVADTCFAILFLRRATKPLPKVATGR